MKTQDDPTLRDLDSFARMRLQLAEDRVEALEKLTHDLERRDQGRKAAIYGLLILVAILAYCVFELQGCVRHTGDTTQQLPY